MFVTTLSFFVLLGMLYVVIWNALRAYRETIADAKAGRSGDQ
jgi:hypothetical protein